MSYDFFVYKRAYSDQTLEYKINFISFDIRMNFQHSDPSLNSNYDYNALLDSRMKQPYHMNNPLKNEHSQSFPYNDPSQHNINPNGMPPSMPPMDQNKMAQGQGPDGASKFIYFYLNKSF